MTYDLTLSIQHTDGTLAVITAAGEIDIDTAPMLRTRALEVIAEGHPHLIVDLTGITFCDSSGLNALIGILRCAKDANGSLALATVPDRLARMLDLTGVSTLMPSYASSEAALGAHQGTVGIAAPHATRIGHG